MTECEMYSIGRGGPGRRIEQAANDVERLGQPHVDAARLVPGEEGDEQRVTLPYGGTAGPVFGRESYFKRSTPALQAAAS